MCFVEYVGKLSADEKLQFCSILNEKIRDLVEQDIRTYSKVGEASTVQEACGTNFDLSHLPKDAVLSYPNTISLFFVGNSGCEYWWVVLPLWWDTCRPNVTAQRHRSRKSKMQEWKGEGILQFAYGRLGVSKISLNPNNKPFEMS